MAGNYSSWQGWTNYESTYDYDDPRGLYTMQYNGNAYGRYQFDYQFGLVPFMQYCVNHDPVRYAGFNPYIAMGAGNTQLIMNQALHQLFIDYTNLDFDEFQWLQDCCGIEQYLEPALALMSWTPTDPVEIGSLFSLAIRGGYYTAYTCMPASNPGSAAQTVAIAYNNMSQIHYDGGRWVPGGGSQFDQAMSAIQTGDDVFGIPWGYIPKPRIYPWMFKKRGLTITIKRRY